MNTSSNLPDRNRRSNQNRNEWKESKRFTNNGFAVAISTQGALRPRFSIQVGKLRSDGTITPHLPVHIDGTFQIRVSPFDTEISSLLTQAREWISTEAALRVSEDVEKRIERETKQAAFGKQETRVTGKTARKKARRIGQTNT